MSHPAVQACAEAAAIATEKAAELDARLVASDGEITELLASSRAAIARSRDILTGLYARGA